MNHGHDRRWVLWVALVGIALHFGGFKLPSVPTPTPIQPVVVLPTPSSEIRAAVKPVATLCAANPNREAVQAIGLGWQQFAAVLIANKPQLIDVARAKDVLNQYMELDARARGLGGKVDGYGPAVEKAFVEVFGAEGDKAGVDKFIEFVAALAEIK